MNNNNQINKSHVDVPSAVLHIRNIPEGTTEDDIFKIAIGKCVNVRLLEKYHQALLEMDSIESATNLLQYSQNNSLLLHGKPVLISYSKSQSINQQQPASTNPTSSQSPSTHRSPNNYNNTHHHSHHHHSHHHQQQPHHGGHYNSHKGSPNQSYRHNNYNNNNNNNGTIIEGRVLLCTIENLGMNIITIDHLYHFFSNSGEVLRIVMFNSNTQALIEFSSIENANNAKKTLNNYSLAGSNQCILRLETSKTDTLNITQNTERSKDFTKSQPIMLSPHFRMQNGTNGNQQQQQQQQQQQYNNNSNNANQSQMVGGNGSTVLLVHGLDETMMNSCDRIFNLFSIYGNVQRVKILTSKKGAALVQMEDAQQAEAIIRYYHQIPLFNNALQTHYSKHLTITDSHNPESPTLSKDYTHSNLNRFSHPINTYKHLYKPSQTLYFSNIPKHFTEANFIQLFTSLNAPKPIGFKIFSSQLLASPTTPAATTTTSTTATTTPPTPAAAVNTTSPTSTATPATTATPTTATTNTSSPITDPSKIDKIVGLLEFASVSNAVEALVLANNTLIPGSHYTIRLSFSNSSVLPHHTTPRNGAPTNSSPSTISPVSTPLKN
ncbi:hypothetical protein CYY_008945 [Polysphondylium violaceum]|uniref:RRM domain-containing protein n=1 Tax=Polysphondylium violaceum TaxID=133409 RepID=A0A8J4PKX9_9MYCE|nr:hypothetical protein CYY_008945 [Polysphondylium violaceum]